MTDSPALHDQHDQQGFPGPGSGARIEGTPPLAARATFDLTPDAVRLMLTAPAAEATMRLLSITGEDREDLLAAIPAAVEDPEILAAVTEEANLLRASAGLDTPAPDLGAHTRRDDALQARITPGRGLVPILAHLVGTDTVRAWHAARGLTPEQSWTALADLGQQMRVHRLTFGSLGLHTHSWTVLNWCGRLFTLGRLQFDLQRTTGEPGGDRWIIGTHIPATGPLTPESVDASFSAATAFFAEHFGDLGEGRTDGAPTFGHEFLCTSWLVNEELAGIVGPDSHLGAFSARWRITGTVDGSDDAAFFIFHRRPPYDPSTFPRGTRLERAVAERLEDGRGWRVGTGRLER